MTRSSAAHRTRPVVAGDGRFSPAYSPQWAVFLDVDGTLLEIAERPDAVRPSAGLTAVLGALREACGGALALISGRDLASLDELFAPVTLPLAGQHGAERRDAAGALHRTGYRREMLRATSEHLRRLAVRDPGLLLEDKGLSLALHFRQAPQLAGFARDAVTAAARMLGGAFEVQVGKMVFEIKPSGQDKGSAIKSFMDEAPFAGRVPVFIGDDVTDEYGFGLVNSMGGLSIKVGRGDSIAHWRLDDAAAVRAWLRSYLDFLHAHTSTP